MTTKKMRHLWTLSILVSLALGVWFEKTARAENELEEAEFEEVYQAGTPAGSAANLDSNRSVQDRVHGDIRLTRPDEAALRVVDDAKTRSVPGIERIREQEQRVAELKVADRSGRSLASSPESVTPQKPDVLPKPKEAPSEYSLSLAPRDARPSLNRQSQELSIIVSDSGFYPARVFTTVGVPVKIYLSSASKGTQCFMLDSWSVRKGIAPGKVEEIDFTPDRPGTFRFYCPVKAIEGSLVVRQAPVNVWSGLDASPMTSPSPAPEALSEATRDGVATAAPTAGRSPAEAEPVEAAPARGDL
jgi:hypothetical protein